MVKPLKSSKCEDEKKKYYFGWTIRKEIIKIKNMKNESIRNKWDELIKKYPILKKYLFNYFLIIKNLINIALINFFYFSSIMVRTRG